MKPVEASMEETLRPDVGEEQKTQSIKVAVSLSGSGEEERLL